MKAPIVLVVDDEEDLRTETCEALMRSGMTVYSSFSPPGGLAILAAHPEITVVLTDIRMAEGDGLVFANSVLRGRSGAIAIEVVVLTGFANLEMALEAVRVRVFAMLRKPPSLREIVAEIKAAHATAQARRNIANLLSDLRGDLGPPNAPDATDLQLSGPKGYSAGKDPIVHLANDGLLNALVPLMGYAEMLEQLDPAALAKDGPGYLSTIRTSSEKLALLVRGTTTLLAIRSGEERVEQRPVTMKELVGGLAAALGPEALGRSVRISNAVNLDKVLSVDAGFFFLAIRLLVEHFSDSLSNAIVDISFALVDSTGRLECSLGLLEGGVSIAPARIAEPDPGLARLGLAAWLAGELCGGLGTTLMVNGGSGRTIVFMIRFPADRVASC